MHIHILGICGSFMGSLAIIAKQLGHDVSGSDENVYPPMSTLLEKSGIELKEGYSIDHLQPMPDQVIVGNVITRGNEIAEFLLNNHVPLQSGPQWLNNQVLRDRTVLAVAGTHGKTTTTSMLAWILEYAGLQPGFLIGGVPTNFENSSRLGDSQYFVIEADEYDTAFFDKRSKFIHYCPHALILNNLEFDHADIFNGIGDIKRQFHHLLRITPSEGIVIINYEDENLRDVIEMGCWTPIESFSVLNSSANWFAGNIDASGKTFSLEKNGTHIGDGKLNLFGRHNIANSIAAIAVAEHLGVSFDTSLEALAMFAGVKRRLEHKGTFNHVSVYDDFAHHPTEIAATISAFKAQSQKGRVVTIFEPRSNTMRLGIHTDTLADAFIDADKVVMFKPTEINWSLQGVADQMRPACDIFTSVDEIIADVVGNLKQDDQILILSNGGFDGLSAKLVSQLTKLSIVH